jgi:Ca-activated chloride channel family protein
MTYALNLMHDEELHRASPADDEPGFGALSTERGALPLAAMEVDARVDGLVARTELSQVFVNTHDTPLEATYVFPLPDRAAVTAFRLEVGGRIVDGLIKERGAARREYDQAIQAGHRAAITEEERAGVFTMRVGNLMPGDRATVKLTLTGPLPVDGGEVSFRFPLVVAPRYIPGVPLGEDVGDGTASDTDAVPDASRISPPVRLPGHPNPVRLAIRVHVAARGLPITNLRSSLHAVSSRQDVSGGATVELRPGDRANRDFILRWSIGDASVRTALVAAPDAEGDGGSFLLTVVPPRDRDPSSAPRDVVFVLDRSGSMDGWKMVAARRAVARMIDALGAADRFQLITFDNVEDHPPGLGSGLATASDRNRFRAVEFLAGVEARGGTEMARPLYSAADLLARRGAGRRGVIVLVTDGQVGNEDQIVRGLSSRLEDVSVFTVGIDRAVNAAFLQRLADLGGGRSELVESEDRLDAVMASIHRRFGRPVLTDLEVIAEGLDIDVDSLTPGQQPDVFEGVPLLIGGRFRGAPRGGLRVRARDARGQTWETGVTAVEGRDDAVHSTWARARVRDLEDRFVSARTGAAREALEREITGVSLRHSVLCRFTAFVAVDRSERVNPGGHGRRVVQPVESPEGWAEPEMSKGASPKRKKMAMPRSPARPSPAPMPVQASFAPGSMPTGGLGYGSGSAGMPTGGPAGAPPPSARAAAAPPPSYEAMMDESLDLGAEGFAEAAEPAPAREEERSLVGGLLDRLRGGRRKEEAEKQGAAPSWTTPPALAERAAELLERLEDEHAAGDADAVSARIDDVARLWVDLQAAGAPEALLERLLRAYQALEHAPLDRGRLETLCAVLRELAGPSAPSTGRGRGGRAFWR